MSLLLGVCSIDVFDLPVNSPISLIDLETGEVSSGDFDQLLQTLFPSPRDADSSSRPDVFKEDGAALPARRHARSAGLVERAISDRLYSSVKISVFADLVSISGSRFKSDAQPINSLRGKVTGFSRRSRVRFMRAMAMTRNLDSDGHFLHLTIPDEIVSRYEDDDAGLRLLCDDVKRWKNTLVKRLLRAFPALRGWWRIELEDRKSGLFVGRLVPHIHLLAWGLEVNTIKLRLLLREAWFDIVGSTDERHLVAGVRADAMFSRRHAMAYASKYAAKESGDDKEAGRRWGCFGELDQSEDFEGTLLPGEWVRLRRYMRKWIASKGRRVWSSLSMSPQVGATVFGLGDLSGRDSPAFCAVQPLIYRMMMA